MTTKHNPQALTDAEQIERVLAEHDGLGGEIRDGQWFYFCDGEGCDAAVPMLDLAPDRGDVDPGAWHRAHQAAVVAARLSARPAATTDTAAQVEAVRALVDREVASTRDSWARSARADVRCLDCDLRYEERQEYGCRAGEGHGHYYPEDWLAEADAKARTEEMRYLTLPLADLLAALDPGTRTARGKDNTA